jgi:hypothetical protein
LPENFNIQAGLQWLMPIVVSAQEAEITRIMVQSQPWANSSRPYLKKTHHKKGLVEWIVV